MSLTKQKHIQQIVCGAAVGAANSLFGGGGGMLGVPLLQKTGLDEKSAHATAILLILPISLFSYFFYAIGGYSDPTVLIPVSLGVTFGGLVGARLLGKLNAKTVNIIFAWLQIAAGLFLFFA